MSDIDTTFYERADAHIHLSNEQMKMAPGPAVAGSTAWGAARFNAWMCVNMYNSKDVLIQMKEHAITQLTEHYAQQLRENFDAYIRDYDQYAKPGVITR